MLCDVRTGFVDAAAVFALQKGASAAQVELLRARLERLADVYLADHGVDVGDLRGRGAEGAGRRAGGGGAPARRRLRRRGRRGRPARPVGGRPGRHGEGFLDEQSFEGKVVGGVVELAAEAGVPCGWLVVGEVADRARGGRARGGAASSRWSSAAARTVVDHDHARGWPHRAAGEHARGGGRGETIRPQPSPSKDRRR